jgi:hypothetical protein
LRRRFDVELLVFGSHQSRRHAEHGESRHVGRIWERRFIRRNLSGLFRKWDQRRIVFWF